jgi:hypothetical protein
MSTESDEKQQSELCSRLEGRGTENKKKNKLLGL